MAKVASSQAYGQAIDRKHYRHRNAPTVLEVSGSRPPERLEDFEFDQRIEVDLAPSLAVGSPSVVTGEVYEREADPVAEDRALYHAYGLEADRDFLSKFGLNAPASDDYAPDLSDEGADTLTRTSASDKPRRRQISAAELRQKIKVKGAAGLRVDGLNRAKMGHDSGAAAAAPARDPKIGDFPKTGVSVTPSVDEITNIRNHITPEAAEKIASPVVARKGKKIKW